MEKKVVYVEPVDYFPKETRKKFKLGEYAESEEKQKEEYIADCGGIQPLPLQPPIFDEDKKEEK